MQIQINNQNHFSLTDALQQHLDKELGAVDKRFGERITNLAVYLSDENGPKGGEDKVCKLEAHPRGMEPVAVSSVNADGYKAIKGAAGKLIKVLEHRVGRQQSPR